MTAVVQQKMTSDLAELAARAIARFDALSPSAKLRHQYMRRRSFARGMCASSTSYEVHCVNVDKQMPHEAMLTDTQIGLILAGEPHD